MSKVNHRRGTRSNKDSEQRKANAWANKRHSKNPLLGPRPLTGSVHDVSSNYPKDGWNSRIRQRENAETRKMAHSLD
jgi:hypothetical protein